MTSSPPLRFFRHFAASQTGAAAAEFVVVLPLMLLISLGMIYLGVIAFAVGELHLATEAAARCGAVNTATCGTTGNTQAYALTQYVGPTITPNFVATIGGSCSTVTGTGTFRFVTGLASFDVPLSATSCYPLQPS